MRTGDGLLKAIDEEEDRSQFQSFSRRNRNKSMDHSKSFTETRELRKKSLNFGT